MRNNLFSLLFLAVFVCGAMAAQAQEKTEARKPPEVRILENAVIDKLAKSAEPAEQQQLLAGLEGKWYYDLKYWDKEGAEPQTSSGMMVNQMVLGGLFLQSETTLLLNIGGQNISYAGRGMLGYDAAKKAYTSVWADNMNTGIITGTGTYDEKLNAIEEKGVFMNPLIGKERAYRSVLQLSDDGTYKRTLFIAGDSGKEFKAIEITFERR